jgi:hypothetical protein
VFPDLLSRTGDWCDFGGKINQGECVDDAAAREFTEESMCVVRLFDSDNPSNIGDYYIKLSVILPPKDGIEWVKVYFVKEVPWQVNVQYDFHRTRKQLLEINNGRRRVSDAMKNHPAVTHAGSIDTHFIEKVEIKWWSLDQLNSIIQKNGVGSKVNRFRRSFLPALRIITKTLGSHVHNQETNTFAKVK